MVLWFIIKKWIFFIINIILKKIGKTIQYYDSLDFHIVIIVFSALSFFCRKITDIKDAIDNWAIIIPISYAKFYNFLLIDKLVDAMDKEKIDLLTNSFIMSFIFFIYDIIVFIISDLIDCDSDYLILFQLIFSILFLAFFIIYIRIYKNGATNNEL